MGGRTYAGLAQPESPFGQGLRGDSGKRDDVAVHYQCKIDVPAPGKNSGQVTVTGKIVSQNSGLQRCRGDSSQTLRVGISAAWYYSQLSVATISKKIVMVRLVAGG
jgi:hypothetical protein